MADYVDRAALRTALYEADAITMRGIFMLNQFPAAEVVEQKRGKWMPIYDGTELGEVYQSGVYCSECDEELQCEPNYCPNCGARMVTHED